MSEPRKGDEFIPVNQVLNSKPQLGPIPGEQVIPWIAIVIISYILCQEILNLHWAVTCLVACWGMATWWALTGNATWQFLNKFHAVPHWTRGHLAHVSLLEQSHTPRTVARTRKQLRSKQRRGRR
jgi:hypothetical protein